MLLENCPLTKASRVADMLINTVREYRFVWDQKTYQVGVSIGIIPILAESTSRKQLMHDANQACYFAKDAGRGRAHIHTGGGFGALGQRRGEKLQRKDISDALASESFTLLYQPIVALDTEPTTSCIPAPRYCCACWTTDRQASLPQVHSCLPPARFRPDAADRPLGY